MPRMLLLMLLFFSSQVFASGTAYEYQVIFLPGTATGITVEKHPSGGYLDPTKTTILNKLAEERWEVISVVGASGADHAAYLRRKKQFQSR